MATMTQEVMVPYDDDIVGHLSTNSPMKDSDHQYLRRGDLVRISECGIEKSKRLKEREGLLGRITKYTSINDSNSPSSFRYDVEWILGGKLCGLEREDLTYRTADEEGMTDTVENRRRKRPPPTDLIDENNHMEEPKKVIRSEDICNISSQQHQQKQTECKLVLKKSQSSKLEPSSSFPSRTTGEQSGGAKKPQSTKNNSTNSLPKKRNSTNAHITAGCNNTFGSECIVPQQAATHKKKKEANPNPSSSYTGTEEETTTSSSSSLDLYERHTREFQRFIMRLKEKVDMYRHFWPGAEPIPPEYDEIYDELGNLLPPSSVQLPTDNDGSDCDVEVCHVNGPLHEFEKANTSSDNKKHCSNQSSGECSFSRTCFRGTQRKSPSNFPLFPPYNWEIVERRFKHGRYILDRAYRMEENHFKLFEPYYMSLKPNERPERQYPVPRSKRNRSAIADKRERSRVFYAFGVDWDTFRHDVLNMCDAALSRSDMDDDCGQRGSLSHTVKKIKEVVTQTYERTGIRHMQEMAAADDRQRFACAVESYENKEAAMQSWRNEPFLERNYERVTSDAVCSGLSGIDERIARYELRTNLPDSFIAQSYRYNDVSLSEVWMKSVVDETETMIQNDKVNDTIETKKKSVNVREERQKSDAANASKLSLRECVTRAQVNATMQALMIAVQDRVMTESQVLQQQELKSSHWKYDYINSSHNTSMLNDKSSTESLSISEPGPHFDDKRFDTMHADIVEKPVWGIDCYTRRNICVCLELEFKHDVALSFIEKWLLPAINACPENLAQNIGNAARILEGLPFDYSNISPEQEANSISETPTKEQWSTNPLARALLQKIQTSSPPWLQVAANQLRRARDALGPNFFRIHPKGNGSVLLRPMVKANTLVTFYHGELYPSWRWGEKMDAIEITQQRKDLKPALPDFYNMALERPQQDPRGYGLLFVDASRKAGHGSCLSHSCMPTCEVRVAAVKGELCLAMTTLREVEWGEELTFDYNAVTESLNEYRSAVCLCGYGRCRGSFLHFATADVYQQILNRNSPIASRFASLIKGSLKKVMSDDDDKVLKCHGFQTAAFGAISVNHREVDTEDCNGHGLVDSMDMVPVWLRTYVADTLRYIEYERRALPIALISDNLMAGVSTNIDKGLEPNTTKEPKLETSFFYFSRTQTDFIRTLTDKEDIPSTLSGLQRQHAIQRVASSYWQQLDDEKKQYWKEQAKADYEKKLKAWQLAQQSVGKPNTGSSTKKSSKKNGKHDGNGVLTPSSISFQDADSEGLSAMEQRIQQLTQTLSRVGRVLYRHREQVLKEQSTIKKLTDETNNTTHISMQNHVHPPIKILSDRDVIEWIWNDADGLVRSFIHRVECLRCARSSLLEQVLVIKKRYACFEICNNKADTNYTEKNLAEMRSNLSCVLLEFRKAILDDLKDMSVQYKQNKTKKLVTRNESQDVKTFYDDSSLSEKVKPKSKILDTTTGARFTNADALLPEEHTTPYDTKPCNLSDRTPYHKDYKDHSTPENIESWILHYDERYILEACADVFLLYAHTSNFFGMRAYKVLESTPIEVYARELGNYVPKSVIDEEIENTDQSDRTTSKGTVSVSTERSSKVSKQTKKRCVVCQPDETIAKVTVKYQGDYVLSQLLQWYNAGIGQKPGIPDLLGCALLPRISDCFESELVVGNRLKTDRKTLYEYKIRPRLVEWFQDPYERGSPWPIEIRKAFAPKGCQNILPPDISNSYVLFGSPVLDFLVTGDDSNITLVLKELNAEDKVSLKTSSDGLLSSVDKGRPAQAVSTWVQCESCMKWRKIPWHVDADMLPEKFFCSDNKWNASANNCNAPEDAWDDADALVGADGKVEGSSVPTISTITHFSLDGMCFHVGARFDVQRRGKNKYVVGTVVKVDFTSSKKRVKFHFAKTSSDRDEWLPLDSDRIAPLHSKVTTPCSKSIKSSIDSKDQFPKLLDPKIFIEGARFDVRRSDKDHFTTAVVSKVDLSSLVPRVKFHFSRTSTCRDEWVDVGSDRIAPFNSKTGSDVCEESSQYNHLQKARTSRLKPISKSSKNTGSIDLISKDNQNLDSLGDISSTSKESKRKAILHESKNTSISTKNKRDVLLNMVDHNRRSDTMRRRNGIKDISYEGKYDNELAELEITRTTDIFNEKNIFTDEDSSRLTSESNDELRQADPVPADEFKVGARFDVLRNGKQKFCVGIVKNIVHEGASTKVLFHFPKMLEKFDEWIVVGSPRICALYSRVPCPKGFGKVSRSHNVISRERSSITSENTDFVENVEGYRPRRRRRSSDSITSGRAIPLSSTDCFSIQESADVIKSMSRFVENAGQNVAVIRVNVSPSHCESSSPTSNRCQRTIIESISQLCDTGTAPLAKTSVALDQGGAVSPIPSSIFSKVPPYSKHEALGDNENPTPPQVKSDVMDMEDKDQSLIVHSTKIISSQNQNKVQQWNDSCLNEDCNNRAVTHSLESSVSQCYSYPYSSSRMNYFHSTLQSDDILQTRTSQMPNSTGTAFDKLLLLASASHEQAEQPSFISSQHRSPEESSVTVFSCTSVESSSVNFT